MGGQSFGSRLLRASNARAGLQLQGSVGLGNSLLQAFAHVSIAIDIAVELVVFGQLALVEEGAR